VGRSRDDLIVNGTADTLEAVKAAAFVEARGAACYVKLGSVGSKGLIYAPAPNTASQSPLNDTLFGRLRFPSVGHGANRAG